MKQQTIMLLTILLAFGQGTWAQSFLRGGPGTSVNPYQISSIEDLNQLAADVKDGNTYEGKYFELTTSLDYSNEQLRDGKNFTPIGYGDEMNGKPFSGIFDGGGKTISGITVNMPEAYGVGLFGYISKATIKNVTITNSSFTANAYVGAIVGGSALVDEHASPTIENCHVSSSVTVEAKDYGEYTAYAAGGIIGISSDNLTIKDCTSAATVTSTDTHSKGGIIGVAYESYYMPTIVDSYYLGNLSAIGENGGQNDEIEKYATINITLLDDDSNATVKNATRIANYNGQTATVTLNDRTLYTDGSWNTLCLPFDLTLDGSPLEGATLKKLQSSSFADGVLTLNFEDATGIEAGNPYLVKWDTGDAIATPTFTHVTVSNPSELTTLTDYTDFVGSFSSVSLTADDRTVLYLGADNILYYPAATFNMGSCRARFQLKGLTVGDLAQGANSIVLDFGDEVTGVALIDNGKRVMDNDACYTIDGRRINGKPTKKGVYIHHGKKVVLK